MGKYLKLGADPGAQNWTLPDDTDLDKLSEELIEAMAPDDHRNFRRPRERVLSVTVVVGRDHTAELIINGSACPSAMVWEDAPSGGGMTIID